MTALTTAILTNQRPLTPQTTFDTRLLRTKILSPLPVRINSQVKLLRGEIIHFVS